MTIIEAIETIKKNAKAKFDESVDVHLKLGIDVKKGDQQVRGIVILPHGFGKAKRIAVFTEKEDEIKEIQKLGIDLVGGEDLIEKIKQTGKCDFEVAIATPEIMKSLAKIARILGPKGLMPNPKTETVTTNFKKTIEELQKGKVSFKNDDSGNIHQAIGKVSWSLEKLKENLETFLEIIKKSKPLKSKGIFIKNIALCSTMGKSIKVAIN
ncbi:50S ribosomal protein L1 [Candidatus Kuenenbacteria bacterium HGW-Kuenenbacteria-1]|uniref:Ribosomal protein n=1 Tax=Candidatus Kuenenbacteria bacterium HGW-Kuenenbacteria-1 TaxID=2013812 RepID=A0A2N1UMV2_9BACT|nr:MAG: 50S ribosomal protein L1 [Candidatus Kuenenbacteria bacterium HGW-Kuenenbacteria-1]